MSAPLTRAQKLVPAQVGFLAIYNPSLGNTDETLDDQIVYYASPESQHEKHRRRRASGDSSAKDSQEEKNERLRKIGLAQGMVKFSKDFSEGKPVDTIETEKSRIILHEVEPSWWLIASIDLTQLPISKGKPRDENGIEYSSREVKPPALLLEDLLRAHSTFLLHHASSMSTLFAQVRRPKFVNLLGRYWDSFLSTWNVLLHGNPLVDVFGGIKLAGSGELGMGVGEEDRGSGEREVLEGFVGRIDGLVDLVVSKFGGAKPDEEEEKRSKESRLQAGTTPRQRWLGTGANPSPEDGAVFLGVGALSRKSLRDVTHWMEDLYSWGLLAYGVRDNPPATRKSRKNKRNQKSRLTKQPSPSRDREGSPLKATVQVRVGVAHERTEEHSVGLTELQSTATPIQEGAESSLKRRSMEKQTSLHRERSSQSSTRSVSNTGEKIVNYLKLGYGTHWSLGGSSNEASEVCIGKTSKQDDHLPNHLEQGPTQEPISTKKAEPPYNDGLDTSQEIYDDTVGHYLVGLLGDIEEDEIEIRDHNDTTTDDGGDKGSNHRMLLRTVVVELEPRKNAHPKADISVDPGVTDDNVSHSANHGGSEHTGTLHMSFDCRDHSKSKLLRVVVYVNKPFIFTFLFEPETDALALMGLYKSLHYQLGPLKRPLLASTSRPLLRPDISATDTHEAKAPIYDLVFDSKFLTISSTIPNIPEPGGGPISTTNTASWSRLEALNTHMQLLNTFTASQSNRSVLESTCKTSRGWWVVWTRTPDPNNSSIPSDTPSPLPSARTSRSGPEDDTRTAKSGSDSISNKAVSYLDQEHTFLDRTSVTKERPIHHKEIYLLRRESDYSGGKSSGNFIGLNPVAGESVGGSGTAKLAQGIGVDTKRYIEDLLTMNR